MADLSLELNGVSYIDRTETKIESPKAEVVTPNSEKSILLKTIPDEGSSVDGDLGNPQENDDNEMKDECWIDRCESKITTDGQLISSKTNSKGSVKNSEDNIHSIKNDITDTKKSKKSSSYEITSATSFFISESKKSKDSHEILSSNLSPVKIKEKEVSMLYQMGVEAVGKPVETKSHEEYPLQQTDQADSQMESVAIATEESRRDAAKAGWASIRQDSGEVENYLMEEDDDENVIIHLGSEFSTDTGEDEKTQSIVTIDSIQRSENAQLSSANISLGGGVRLAQEEDTTLLNGSIAKNKLSKLESALSSIGEEDSVRSQREKSVEKPEYKTQVSAESRNLDSDSQKFAQEDKTSIAQSQNNSTLARPGQQGSSQVIGQQNMKMVVDNKVSLDTQEQLTDEKIKSETAIEKANVQQTSAMSVGSSQQIRSLSVNVSNSLDTAPNPNQIEVERKFRISQDCRKKLKDIGAKMVKEKQFTDEYFDDIKYKLTLSNSWLRRRNDKWEFKIPIRHASQGDEITSEHDIVKHLSKLYGVKSSVEKVSIEDMVKELGLDSFATFKTTRQTYHLPNCTIDLDFADFGFEVGVIEVVVSDRSRITEALDIIDEVAKKLGTKTNSSIYGDV